MNRMNLTKNLIFCLTAVLLTVGLFFSLLDLNRSLPSYAADDPRLGELARRELVYLDPGSARAENGGLQYTLLLPDAENLCLFQPKAIGAQLTVNGVEAEVFGLHEQNLVMLSTVPAADGLYRIEISRDGMANLNDISVYLGTLAAVVNCQSTLFFSRFLALGVNILVSLLALTLYLKKRSERYLLMLSLFAAMRLFSSLYLTIASALERLSPPLSGLYMTLYGMGAGHCFSTLLFALLQLLVLRSFAPTRVGRVSLFWPIALSCVPMLFIPAGSRGFMAARLLNLGVTAVCYLISLCRMDSRQSFALSVLTAALALSTSALCFTLLSQAGVVSYGAINLRIHLSIIQTCFYPTAFLLIACDRFAGKFREADALNAELEERIREDTRQHTLFIRSMLHNLKTPLFSLSGYSDMAAATVGTDAARCGAYIAKVKENANYVGRLLDQLFLLTQMDAGQVEFQRINIDLSDLLASICDTTLLAAQKKGLRLEAEVPEGLFVYGDALYLRQALQNIADNAVIHTPEGGSISVKAARLGEGCEITLSDTGCGIPEDELPLIFDRYYSRRRSGRSSSGLGLTISKMLIEANGGMITAQSREGEGACFTVTLPGPRE